MNEQKIRRLAQKHRLTASKYRTDGLWRFINDRNCLVSPDTGLDDEDALKYVAPDSEGDR